MAMVILLVTKVENSLAWRVGTRKASFQFLLAKEDDPIEAIPTRTWGLGHKTAQQRVRRGIKKN